MAVLVGSAVITPADVAELAVAVLEESGRHKPRSRGKRAAGQLWVCLMTTTSLDAAERAITTFGDEQVQADAAELLGRLTKPEATA